MKINLHQTVLTQIDNVESSKRSSLEKAALLFPLSGACLITNIAAATSESLILLGKLSLAGVKYGAIGTLRVLTRSNVCDSVYKKLPDGKSLQTTLIKIRKLLLGIFYSLAGLVDPRFNLRRQQELGLYIKKPAEAKPVIVQENMPQPAKEEEPVHPIITPLPLEKKKTMPKGSLKKPEAKKIRKMDPATREELAKVQMAKFLRAFQIMERNNTSLPEKKVHFAPDTALVQVFPIQKIKREAKQETPRQDNLLQKIGKDLTAISTPFSPTLGAVAGVGAAILANTAARSDNLVQIPLSRVYTTGSTLADAAGSAMKDVVAPMLGSTLANNMTTGPTAQIVIRDVVAPTLVSTLANATTAASMQAAPTLLANVTSNCTALAAPALTLAQLVPASLPVAVSNATCSIVATAVNALAAPALTVAQIINGNAPIVATELAKQVPMSWTSVALIVGSLAIRALPMFSIPFSGS